MSDINIFITIIQGLIITIMVSNTIFGIAISMDCIDTNIPDTLAIINLVLLMIVLWLATLN